MRRDQRKDVAQVIFPHLFALDFGQAFVAAQPDALLFEQSMQMRRQHSLLFHDVAHDRQAFIELLSGVAAIDGEFLHAFIDTEQVRTHLPVRVRYGGSVLNAGSMQYDNLAQKLDLGPPVRAVMTPRAVKARP